MYSFTFTYSCCLPILKSLLLQLLVFLPPTLYFCPFPSSLQCLPFFSPAHITQPFLTFPLLQHPILHVSIHTTSKLTTPATATATATSTATFTTITIATTVNFTTATSAATTTIAANTTTTTIASTTTGTTTPHCVNIG